MNDKIISPCISVGNTDTVTGYCQRWARTEQEKRIRKNDNTSNKWKSKNLETIISRMKGWQLNTFKESYDYKISNGISLFKKKILEKN